MVFEVFIVGLLVRLLWFLVPWWITQSWLWRDYLDQTYAAFEIPPQACCATALRRRLFWTFVRERAILFFWPETTLCWQIRHGPYTGREKRRMIRLSVLQVLVTLGLLFPAGVFGLPAAVTSFLYRCCWWPLQARLDEMAALPQVETSMRRQVQTIMSCSWDDDEVFPAHHERATLAESKTEDNGAEARADQILPVHQDHGDQTASQER